MKYTIYSDGSQIFALPEGEDLSVQEEASFHRLTSIEAASADAALDTWIEDCRQADRWSIA